MKIIFLDIDGVVNCAKTRLVHEGFIDIDPAKAELVKQLIKNTGAKVVLSSTWRLSESSRERVKELVTDFIDVTPRFHFDHIRGDRRGEEVADWLSRHPEVTRYAILDDDNDFLPGQPLFKSTWQDGLTEEIAKLAEDYLNSEMEYVPNFEGGLYTR